MHGMPDEYMLVFRPGDNCWAVSRASHAAVLVDYANYYEALHQAIGKAKKSVFVLGWDIDLRIELLRGRDAREGQPTTFFDLICEKACANPDIQIYLNKWDYSVFFMQQREPMWRHKWRKCDLPNVHVCLDSMVPLGGCHHQKIILVDDEIAFWGGMDVALGRWDKRQHHPVNALRRDPGGLPEPEKEHKFGPYHDIQAVLAGPAVADVARWVRHRWRAASDVIPRPFDPPEGNALPASWPDKFPPVFENVPVAIARTLPPTRNSDTVKEIERLYAAEIEKAEEFIYIENQYLTCQSVAAALNRALHRNPRLRVLAVSCHTPQGYMERKVMWAGRTDFYDTLVKGGMAGQVGLAYPVSHENGIEKSVHIHSKIMVIDDKYLHIGSSNIAHRSMGLDSEFDITLIGADAAARKQIAATRNDLIREHSGREIADIQTLISDGASVARFFNDVPTSRQHLRPIDTDKYRGEKWAKLAQFFGDPKGPWLPTWGQFRRARWRGGLDRIKVPLIVCAVLAAVLTMLWTYTPMREYTSVEGAVAMLKKLSASPWSLVYATGLYTLGGVLFFPITAMTAACVVVFGPLKGVAVSFLGAILSGLIGLLAGRWLGHGWIEKKFGRKAKLTMEKVRDAGVTGIALIRVVPAAPYPLSNMLFGAAKVSVVTFVVGTVLGLAPGKLALALTGDGIMKIIEKPNAENMFYLAIGIALWLGVIVVSHKIAKRLQKGKQGKRDKPDAA